MLHIKPLRLKGLRFRLSYIHTNETRKCLCFLKVHILSQVGVLVYTRKRDNYIKIEIANKCNIGI